VGDSHLNNNRQLFFDVERYYFFNLDIPSHHYLLDDRLVNEDFDLSDQFLFVTFDEMRTVDVDLFGDLSHQFLFDFQLHINRFLDSVGDSDRFIPVFEHLNELQLRHFDLNRHFDAYFYLFLFFNDVRNLFLYFD
jgi:hypothetical protein